MNPELERILRESGLEELVKSDPVQKRKAEAIDDVMKSLSEKELNDAVKKAKSSDDFVMFVSAVLASVSAATVTGQLSDVAQQGFVGFVVAYELGRKGYLEDKEE